MQQAGGTWKIYATWGKHEKSRRFGSLGI